jgi:hypothetical protein
MANSQELHPFLCLLTKRQNPSAKVRATGSAARNTRDILPTSLTVLLPERSTQDESENTLISER